MTNRLMKTKRDHRRLRGMTNENIVALNMTPAAGALAGGTVGTPHAGVTFALTNAVGKSHFAVAVGNLPAGMSLNPATGALTGTPTEAGANSFSIRGTDDFGNSKTQAYTLAVAAE